MADYLPPFILYVGFECQEQNKKGKKYEVTDRISPQRPKAAPSLQI